MTKKLSPSDKRPDLFVQSINELSDGRIEACGRVTLPAGETSTVVSNRLITPNTIVVAMGPDNSICVDQTSIVQGEFIITHSSEGTDRIAGWLSMTPRTLA